MVPYMFLFLLFLLKVFLTTERKLLHLKKFYFSFLDSISLAIKGLISIRILNSLLS